MAKPAGPRTVQCYLCRHPLEVSSSALSTVCPGCHKTISLEDFVLKKNKPKLVMVSKLQTCGRVVVPRGARLVAELVEAHGGVEVSGHLESRRVLSGGCAVIGKKAHWKGDLQAPALVVGDQAVIERSFFQVSAPAVEQAPPEGHSRAPPPRRREKRG